VPPALPSTKTDSSRAHLAESVEVRSDRRRRALFRLGVFARCHALIDSDIRSFRVRLPSGASDEVPTLAAMHRCIEALRGALSPGQRRRPKCRLLSSARWQSPFPVRPML